MIVAFVCHLSTKRDIWWTRASSRPCSKWWALQKRWRILWFHDHRKGLSITQTRSYTEPSAQTVCTLVLCSECLKPRVVYSRQKPTILEEHALQCTGNTLKGLEVDKLSSDPPSVQTLMDCIFVWENPSCDDGMRSRIWGGYPMCQHCRQSGHLPLYQRKRKIFHLLLLIFVVCVFLVLMYALLSCISHSCNLSRMRTAIQSGIGRQKFGRNNEEYRP